MVWSVACSHLHEFIDQGHVQDARDESSTDTLDFVGAGLASTEDRGLAWLHSYNLQVCKQQCLH